MEIECLNQLTCTSALAEIHQHLVTQVFNDGREIKRSLLTGDNRTRSSDVVQSLMLEAAKNAVHSIVPVYMSVTYS